MRFSVTKTLTTKSRSRAVLGSDARVAFRIMSCQHSLCHRRLWLMTSSMTRTTRPGRLRREMHALLWYSLPTSLPPYRSHWFG